MKINFKQYSQLYDFTSVDLLEGLTENQINEIFGFPIGKNSTADERKKTADKMAADAKKRGMTVDQYKKFLQDEINRVKTPNMPKKSDPSNNGSGGASSGTERARNAADRGAEYSDEFKFS